MDWLGKMIGLPDEFLHTKPHSPGGGVIQTTCSEATFVCLLAGRTEAIKRHQKLFPEMEDADINSRLVAYCSDQAHSSVEKAGLIGLVKIRYIETDDQLSLRGDKLREAIDNDRKNGYVPFFVRSFLLVEESHKYLCDYKKLSILEWTLFCKNDDIQNPSSFSFVLWYSRATCKIFLV